MAPVALALLRQLRAAGGGLAETPHEHAFQGRHLPALREALSRLQQPAAEDVQHPEAAWKPLKRLRDAMAIELRCAPSSGRAECCCGAAAMGRALSPRALRPQALEIELEIGKHKCPKFSP